MLNSPDNRLDSYWMLLSERQNNESSWRALFNVSASIKIKVHSKIGFIVNNKIKNLTLFLRIKQKPFSLTDEI
jgi:hypothetical protein